MRVILQRNLFLGGQRYRRDRFGTEIPDEVDGKRVVFADPKSKDLDPEKFIVLPVDTQLYKGEPDERRSNDLISHATAIRPTALSELMERPGRNPNEAPPPKRAFEQAKAKLAADAEAAERTVKVPRQEDQIAENLPDTAHKAPTSKEPLEGRAPNLPKDESGNVDKEEVAQESSGARVSTPAKAPVKK